jgi:hypothetical protein
MFINDLFNKKTVTESLRPGERHHFETDPKTGKRVYKGIRGDQHDTPKRDTAGDAQERRDRDTDAMRKHDRRMTEQDIDEAREGDTNFGSTVTQGSWVVYDGSKVKRFKTRDGAKAYAEKNGGKVASSEFYADNVQKQGVAEAGPFSYGAKKPRKGSVADLAAY